MILSDRYRFVFVHIPKCAGTSVRQALLSFDDAGKGFPKPTGIPIAVHPELGQIDYRHLPLGLLRYLDRESFDKLNSYESYALMRDPFQRFRSAMAQRAKMYVGKELAKLDAGDIHKEIERVIAYLESEPEVITSDFIHFARQSDFIEIDGRQVVRNLYPVERLDAFVEAIGRHFGSDMIEIGHANESQVMRLPQFKKVLYSGSALAKRLLPGSVHQTLRTSARKVLMKPSAAAAMPVFETPYVRDFIDSYYARDSELYQRVLAGSSSPTPDAVT